MYLWYRRYSITPVEWIFKYIYCLNDFFHLGFMDSVAHNHTCAFIYFGMSLTVVNSAFSRLLKLLMRTLWSWCVSSLCGKLTRNSAELSKYGWYNMASTNSTASRKFMVKSHSVLEEQNDLKKWHRVRCTSYNIFHYSCKLMSKCVFSPMFFRDFILFIK